MSGFGTSDRHGAALHSAGGGGEHVHAVTSKRTLLIVLLSLLALTALTVFTAEEVHLGGYGNLFVAILISVSKSVLVVLFFMHLLHDRAFNAVVLFFCLLTIVAFLGFTLIDMGSRGMIKPTSAGFIAPPDTVLQARLNDPRVIRGKEVFLTSCSACHGRDAKGVPGLGKDMTTSDFIASTNDEDLLKFIIHGRAASDPMNTTGVPMLPRGGNPTITDDQLRDIIAFIRILRPYTGADVEREASH